MNTGEKKEQNVTVAELPTALAEMPSLSEAATGEGVILAQPVMSASLYSFVGPVVVIGGPVRPQHH